MRRAFNRLLGNSDFDDRDGIFRFQNSFHVARFRSGEWLNDITRVDEFMDVLSRMSNSNEQFEVNVTFQIECGLSTPSKTKFKTYPQWRENTKSNLSRGFVPFIESMSFVAWNSCLSRRK